MKYMIWDRNYFSDPFLWIADAFSACIFIFSTCAWFPSFWKMRWTSHTSPLLQMYKAHLTQRHIGNRILIPSQLKKKKTSLIGKYFNFLNNVIVVGYILKLSLSCLVLEWHEKFPSTASLLSPKGHFLCSFICPAWPLPCLVLLFPQTSESN